MPKYQDTKRAGDRAEETVRDFLFRYADAVYHNIRLPTLYTASGETEIDLLAVMRDVLIVVEVKNIRAIEGTVLKSYWTLTGYETGAEYTALNILTQNRIHVRALKRLWYSVRGDFPLVLSVVVVPSGCSIPPDIHEAGVMCVDEFLEQIAELRQSVEKSPRTYEYTISYVLSGVKPGY